MGEAHDLDYENGTMYAQTCKRCGTVRTMRATRSGWTMVWRSSDGTEKRSKKGPPCVPVGAVHQ